MDHTDVVARERELEEEGQTIDPRVCPRCSWGRWFLTRPVMCSEFPDRVHQGDTIIIPKGAVVETYATRGIFEAGRTYRVRVNHFIGSIPRWSGESGYWTWTTDWTRS
jgi:hypothetical protein